MYTQHFLNLNCGNIEVLESSGKDTAIICFHGNSSAASSFSALLNSELGQKHRIIAVSWPGHGNSDFAIDVKRYYNIPALSQLAAEVISKLALPEYFLLGQSVGGHALLQGLENFHDVKGLFLISAPPLNLALFSQAFKPDPSGGLLFKGDFNQQEAERFAECFIYDTTHSSFDGITETMMQTDPHFRSTLGESLAEAQFLDEVAAAQTCPVPLALLAGSEDAFLQMAYFEQYNCQALWRNQAIILEQKGHALQLEASEDILTLLKQFIDDARTTNRAHAQHTT